MAEQSQSTTLKQSERGRRNVNGMMNRGISAKNIKGKGKKRVRKKRRFGGDDTEKWQRQWAQQSGNVQCVAGQWAAYLSLCADNWHSSFEFVQQTTESFFSFPGTLSIG